MASALQSKLGVLCPCLRVLEQAEGLADGWMIFTTDANVPLITTLAD